MNASGFIFFGSLFLFGTRVLKVRDTTFVCNNDKKVDRFLDIAMCCDSDALHTCTPHHPINNFESFSPLKMSDTIAKKVCSRAPTFIVSALTTKFML